MVYAGKKWHKNQKLLDKKLEAETEMARQTFGQMIGPEKEIVGEGKEAVGETIKDEVVALVTYKIASILPNTISFNFLKDWQVWFLLENREKKKYKAYIKIKFISDGYEKELDEGYFGGVKAWNLNALSAIMAPGLGIPEEIKEKAKERKKIEIRIFCEVKDENDKLIEKKLPAGYVYDYENNSWYYEP